MVFLFVCLILAVVVWLYFKFNPLKHGSWFMMRRFINWFPLGMSYAFLYLARFNIIASQQPLSMSNKDFGFIFGGGSLVYALSLLFFVGFVVDRIGGRKGIMISTFGTGITEAILGYICYLWLVDKPAADMTLYFGIAYAVNMFFQSFGAVSIIKVKAYWFHVRERGVFGAIFGTLISLGVYLGFDWNSSIVRAAEVQPKNPTFLHSVFVSLFHVQAGHVTAVWLVYFLPAAFLIGWGIIDYFLIKDLPSETGLEDFDTADASSGEMHKEFTVGDLVKRVFLNPIMMMIGLAELFEGFVRNSIVQWYKPFIEQMHLIADAQFYYHHLGFLLMLSGIIGGFAGGYISDKYYQSRRFPPTAMAFALAIFSLIIMAVYLFKDQPLVGACVVAINLFTIAVTALMSGTAASDFGGRKATATAAGVTDAFVYFGGAIESFCIPVVIKHSWVYWPLFLIPFAIFGLIISIKMLNYLPEATRRYILTVEKISIGGPSGSAEMTTASLKVDDVTTP